MATFVDLLFHLNSYDYYQNKTFYPNSFLFNKEFGYTLSKHKDIIRKLDYFLKYTSLYVLLYPCIVRGYKYINQKHELKKLILTQQINEDVCSICYDPLDENVIESCNNKHQFHTNCLKNWINNPSVYNNKSKCPLCMDPIKTSVVDSLDDFNKYNNMRIIMESFDNYVKTIINYRSFIERELFWLSRFPGSIFEKQIDQIIKRFNYRINPSLRVFISDRLRETTIVSLNLVAISLLKKKYNDLSSKKETF